MRKTAFLLALLLGLGMVFAAPVENLLHVNVQATDGSGHLEPGNYLLGFNISTSVSCTPVLYSYQEAVSTDARGIVDVYLPNVTLDFTEQYYLCYYRNDTLKSNGKIANAPYLLGTSNWDKNVSDDFNGDYGSLSNKPLYLSNFTNDVGFITGYNESDPLFTAANGTIWSAINQRLIATANACSPREYSRFNGTGFECFTDSGVGNETDPLFAAWGYNWANLTNVPVGFADGVDNDTLYFNLSEFLNDVGFITGYNESDPLFSAENGTLWSAINQKLTATANICVPGEYSSWNGTGFECFTDSGVGNETDPLFAAWGYDYGSLVNNPIDLANFTNTPGYITGFNESDPVFGVNPAFNISNLDINNWNAAYGWGDHSLAGYLTVESDPVFSAENSTIWGALNLKANLSHTHNASEILNPPWLTVEADPVWTAAAPNYVQFANTTDWDKNASNDFTSNQSTDTSSSVIFNNVTVADGQCVGGASGGYICFNSTNTWIG